MTTPTLRLTALIYPSHDNPAVYIGRVVEIGGIFAQNDSVESTLADLREAVPIMMPYKMAEFDALRVKQGVVLQPALEWELTYDEAASQAEYARITQALSEPPKPYTPTEVFLQRHHLNLCSPSVGKVNTMWASGERWTTTTKSLRFVPETNEIILFKHTHLNSKETDVESVFRGIVPTEADLENVIRWTKWEE